MGPVLWKPHAIPAENLGANQFESPGGSRIGDESARLKASNPSAVSVSTAGYAIALVLALGYALYGSLPGTRASFGRFCDLNFGRVLALTMAVTSVAAVFTGAAWLQNIAFVAFVIFWIQGLAIVHWLHVEWRVHAVAVIGVYAALFLLSPLVVIALAVVGYADAWFGLRNRMKRA